LGGDPAPFACASAELWASRLLDGRIGIAEAEAVWTHLARCPSCAAFLSDLLRIRDRLQALARSEAAKRYLEAEDRLEERD